MGLRWWCGVFAASVLVGCVDLSAVQVYSCDDAGVCTALDGGERVDAGTGDEGFVDAGRVDAGIPDAGSVDAGAPDAGLDDAGFEDAGLDDAGLDDAGVPDAGRADAGTTDAGRPDAGATDAGRPDAGSSDAGGFDAGLDAGRSDAGSSDAGFDAGRPDSGTDAGFDAGFDAGRPDAGLDAGVDAGRPDSGTDAGPPDSGTPDAGPPDAGPPPTVTFSGPSAVEAGACVSLLLTRAGAVTNPLTLSMSTSSPALSLSTDSSCSSSNGTVSWSAGASTAVVYVDGHSSPNSSVTVTVGTSSTSIVALPLVRRGRCTIPVGQTSSSCAISPPIPGADISRSFLITQSLSAQTEPDRTFASCALETGGAAQVFCRRAGTAADLIISWQAVSFGRAASAGGWSVRHTTSSDLASTTDFNLAPAINAGSSFALLTLASTGSYWNTNDFAQLELSDATMRVRVGLSGTSTPNFFNLQLVESPTLIVEHLVRSSPAFPLDVDPMRASLTNSVPLLSLIYSGSSSTQNIPCAFSFTVSPTATAFRVARSTNGNCVELVQSVSLQLVQFPAGTVIQSPLVTMPAPSLTVPLSLVPALEAHRTLLVFPEMGTGTFGGGVGPATVGPPSEVTAVAELASDGGFVLNRATGTFDVDFRPYAVQFLP